MSTQGGRSASIPWSRLKPANLDPLESMGLPSKGDNRLLDHKTQERYYTKIVERYMAFCSSAGKGDELLRRLAQLEIADSKVPSTTQPLQRASSSTPPSTSSPNPQHELSVIMMSMRKLREGIVASNRVDGFSIQAYLFCIRLSIQVKHTESYHPALLHLLRRMHPIYPLTPTELQEVGGYTILDLACRQLDLTQAYEIRQRYKLKDTKVDAALRALAHDNYYLFWRVKRSVDGHKAKLMEWAEEGMRRIALKCLGRSYLGIELEGLEMYTGSTWGALVKKSEVGWQLDGTKVVIRKPKTR